VAFVEVKGRRGSGWGHPLESITLLKRREIESVARWWIANRGRPGDRYRFDAVAVWLVDSRRPRVEHVEDAWRPAS
jgi:putative endonuclease